MEDNDRAIAGITLDHLKDSFWCHVRAVITRHHIPHDHPILSLKEKGLRNTHVSMRWAKQVAGDVFRCLRHVRQIVLGPITPSLDMVESMITNAVPPINDHLIDVRMLPHIVAYHKEGGFHAKPIQRI